MKYILILIAIVFSFGCVNGQTLSYKIESDYFTVDTGICKLNNPAKFRFKITVYTGYVGLRFKWKLDFGDSTFANGNDTLKNLVFSDFNYTSSHNYITASNKTVKLYLLDSTNTAIDSVVNAYDVGNCSIAGGIVYSDAKLNCTYDLGEAVFGYSFFGVTRNGSSEYYWLDSTGYYNIPVFAGDSIVARPVNPYCSSLAKITPTHLYQDFDIVMSNYGYFDTVIVPKQICAKKYYQFLYTGVRGTSSITYDLGDGSGKSNNLHTHVDVPFGFIFDHAGDFLVTFEAYDAAVHVMWRQQQWVHVDNCIPIALDLYYDGNNNCQKDPGEYTVDTAIFNLDAKIEGYRRYYTSEAGRINLLVYPGDTVMLDTAAQYYQSSTGTYYIGRVDSCGPAYLTGASDSIVYLAFKPGYVTGNVYTDANNDCVYSNNDKGVGGQTITASKNGTIRYAALTDSNGNYRLPVIPRDSFVITSQTPAVNGLAATCAGNYFIINWYGDTIIRSFGYQCSNGVADDAAVLMYHNNFSKGAIDTLYIDLSTAACLNGPGILTVYLDNGSTYLQSSLAPASVKGNQLVYNIADLSSFNGHPIKIAHSIVNSTAIGKIVCYSAYIAPSFADTDTTNNVTFLCDSVNNGLPDNYKSLSVQNDTAGNISFIYTIGFSNKDSINLGSLIITDTLSSALNASTAVLYQSSHPVVFTRTNNVLRFEFTNVTLTSWAQDSVNSNAFIRFKIKPVLPVASFIPNAASYYIDTLAIAKSNSANYPTGFPPWALHILNINNNNNLISVYPNPATKQLFVGNDTQTDISVSIMSLDGRVVRQAKLNAGISTIAIESLVSGSYVIIAANKDKTIVCRQLIIKQ